MMSAWEGEGLQHNARSRVAEQVAAYTTWPELGHGDEIFFSKTTWESRLG
jgi:hypothetical protein